MLSAKIMVRSLMHTTAQQSKSKSKKVKATSDMFDDMRVSE